MEVSDKRQFLASSAARCPPRMRAGRQAGRQEQPGKGKGDWLARVNGGSKQT